MSTISKSQHAVAHRNVYEAVRRQIDECPHRSALNEVNWHFEDGCLTLYGSVPSFYLKQFLQELLRGIERVTSIANHVEVVGSDK